MKSKAVLIRVAALAAAMFMAGSPVLAAEERNWIRVRVEAHEEAHRPKQPGPRRVALPPPPPIVGGTEASPGKWPWQVALLNKKIADNHAALFCGGTLIRARFVVTAAHCVDDLTRPVRQMQVLTGTRSLARGGTRRNIKDVTLHPKWNPKAGIDYDIAVIELATAATGIRLPSLITRAQARTRAAPGRLAVATGWGDTRNSERLASYPTTLRQVSLKIQPQRDCNDADTYSGQITARSFCAGFDSGGKDTCQGDSGGPLVVRDGDGQYRLLAGVTSSGIGCADPEKFGVYTRISVLRGWILEQLH